MSGGSYDYAYLKMQDVFQRVEDDQALVDLAISVISKMMQDVEWDRSGDSTFDTKTAMDWFNLVEKLCSKVSDQYPNPIEKLNAPLHFPNGKPHCQFCGAEEKDFNLTRSMRSSPSTERQA